MPPSTPDMDISNIMSCHSVSLMLLHHFKLMLTTISMFSWTSSAWYIWMMYWSSQKLSKNTSPMSNNCYYASKITDWPASFENASSMPCHSHSLVSSSLPKAFPWISITSLPLTNGRLLPTLSRSRYSSALQTSTVTLLKDTLVLFLASPLSS